METFWNDKIFDPIQEYYATLPYVAVKGSGWRLMSLEPMTALCVTDKDGKYQTDSLFNGPVVSRIIWGTHAWQVFAHDQFMAQTVDTLRTFRGWRLNIDTQTPQLSLDFIVEIYSEYKEKVIIIKAGTNVPALIHNSLYSNTAAPAKRMRV